MGIEQAEKNPGKFFQLKKEILDSGKQDIMASKNLLGITKVAEFIKSGRCKNICFLTGAGISVSSGIPDFRSPGGMYDTLRPELLTASAVERAMMHDDPTAVVSWDLFEDNQFPYLELRRPFILGVAEKKWKATLGHWFVQMIHDHNQLIRLYTQNIDGLDFQTDLPKDKIISVHGTLGRIECEGCSTEYDGAKFREQVKENIRDIYSDNPGDKKKESKNIPCENCGQNLVKPATVLYGRSLPDEFSDCIDVDKAKIDLLFIIGTSLTVYPAAWVPSYVRDDCMRVIIDKNRVGEGLIDYKSENSGTDIHLSGAVDEMILELINELGWIDAAINVKDKLAPSSLKLLEDFLDANASPSSSSSSSSSTSSASPSSSSFPSGGA